MHTPHEALKLILDHPYRPATVQVALNDAVGRVLANDALCDTDLPPFDRVMMDGVALRFKDFESGARTFTISGIQKAGAHKSRLDEGHCCLEIMTGAVCPEGADVIVPYELLKLENGQCTIATEEVKQWQNIHKHGTDKKKGEVLLPKNTLIRAADIGALASIGCSVVSVYALPTIHIISTGDELVEVDDVPEPHQIRRSNVHALKALMKQHGIMATTDHLPDDEATITSALSHALRQYDVVILSGGVSKGKYDLIPNVMDGQGVKRWVHGIAQKPGKPMWFGVRDSTTVFALPGNPVSTWMCAVRYVLPWLRHSMHMEEQVIYARLATDYHYKKGMTHYLSVRLHVNEEGVLMATPLAGHGSGDFAHLAHVDAFAELNAEADAAKSGSAVRCFPFRSYV